MKCKKDVGLDCMWTCGMRNKVKWLIRFFIQMIMSKSKMIHRSESQTLEETLCSANIILI